MKFNKNVSSSRTKNRRAHFQATSFERRKLMSAHLSVDLRDKHGVRAVPIRKSDEVQVMRGEFKGQSGKVLTVYRKKWCIHIEKMTKEKINGQVVPAPIHPSNCMIVKLKIDKDRKSLLERKARGRKQVKGEKYSVKEIAQVD